LSGPDDGDIAARLIRMQSFCVESFRSASSPFLVVDRINLQTCD
jgi:hypothetical protein